MVSLIMMGVILNMLMMIMQTTLMGIGMIIINMFKMTPIMIRLTMTLI
jgi:hypothetical protein